MGLREMASLLQAHGHPEARQYPLPMLWTETRIVRQRVNREMANQTALQQLAIASVLSEKAQKALSKRLKQLTET